MCEGECGVGGDFAITHDDEQLVLSFCYPPLGVSTDYTKIAPKVTEEAVAIETTEINERDAVENRRRRLRMVDYYRGGEKK